jgi:hypothetical protein
MCSVSDPHPVRRCIFTNYCEGLDQKHKPVTCQLWDRDFDAPDADTVRRSSDGKRRLPPPPRPQPSVPGRPGTLGAVDRATSRPHGCPAASVRLRLRPRRAHKARIPSELASST